MANGQAIPQQMAPGTPQMPEAARFMCFNCKQELLFRFPRPKFMNAPDVTVLTFVHARLDVCPHCGLKYMFVIGCIDETLKLGVTWVPVQTEQKGPTIAAGTNENLKLALDNNEIAAKLKAIGE